MARAFDWLWRAACWEASAIDAESAGAATTARRCRYRAREIVAAAAQSAA
jgi:hypothetical protein